MENLELPGSFGDWLKARRRALDLTQEELAGRVGYSIFALRKIESGERRPSKQLAGLLAAAVKVPEKDQPSFIRVARGELIAETKDRACQISVGAEKHPGNEQLQGIRAKRLEQSLETIMNGVRSS